LGGKTISIQTYGPSWGLGCPSTGDVHRKTGARSHCGGGSGGPIVVWRLVVDRRATGVDSTLVAELCSDSSLQHGNLAPLVGVWKLRIQGGGQHGRS